MKKIAIIWIIGIILSSLVLANGVCTIKSPYAFADKRVYCPEDTIKVAQYSGTSVKPVITIGKGAEATSFPVKIAQGGYIQVKLDDGKWHYLISDGYVNSYVSADNSAGRYWSSETYYNNLDIKKLPKQEDKISVVSGGSEGYEGAGIAADYTWRQGQIDSIKYIRKIGESIDGYEYYEVDTQTEDGIGVLRVPSQGSEENVAFAKGIGTDVDSIANADRDGDFYSVEIQDSPARINNPELKRAGVEKRLPSPTEPIITEPPIPTTPEERTKQETSIREQQTQKALEESLQQKTKKLNEANAEWLAASRSKDTDAMAAASKKIEDAKADLAAAKAAVEGYVTTTPTTQITPGKTPTTQITPGKTPTTGTITYSYSYTDSRGKVYTESKTFTNEKERDAYKKKLAADGYKDIKEKQGTSITPSNILRRVTKDGKFQILKGDQVIYVSDDVIHRDQIWTQERNKLIEEWAKKNPYSLADFTDESGTRLLVQGTGKNKKYFRASLTDNQNEFTIKGPGTEVKPGDTVKSTRKIGASIVEVEYTIDEATKQPVAKKIFDQEIDSKMFQEIINAAGKKGTVTKEGNMLVVKIGNQRLLETEKKGNTITTSRFTNVAGRTYRSSRISSTPNSRTEETFEPLFKDKDGKIITQKVFAEAEGDKKIDSLTKTRIVKKITADGETTESIEQYDSSYGLKFKDGVGTLEFRDKYIYDKNGKFKEYVFVTSDGKEIKFADGKPDGLTDEKQIALAQSARSRASFRRRFATFEYAFTEFTGLSGFSQLFFSKEDLAEWRESVDEVFNNVILGGSDYWSSEICSVQYDKSIDGVSYAQTNGILEAAANIQAERSEAIELPGGTQYFYKITYYVNAKDEDVSFNIYLSGERTTQLFTRDQLVTEGEDISATNERAIVQYSPVKYNKICIDFTAGDIPGTCNIIPESDYSLNNYINSGEQEKVTPNGMNQI